MPANCRTFRRVFVGWSLFSLVCAAELRAQTPVAQFQESAAAAGIDFVHWNGNLPPGTYGPARCALVTHGAAAVGDYDNDGWPDLYVTRIHAKNLLYRNRGDGTFEEVGAAAGVDIRTHGAGCLWFDVDNDGDLDLYVMTFNSFGRNYLFINDGAGRFTDEAEARNVDFTGTTIDSRVYSSASAGDYDRDGDVDLLVLAWDAAPRNTLLDNDGTGHFTNRTFQAGLFPPFDGEVLPLVMAYTGYFIDMNNDGWPDLPVTADFGTSRLARNLGDRTFEDITRVSGVATDENGMGAAIGDIDNDGDFDWFVTSIYDDCYDPNCIWWGNSGNRLYRNDGNMQFTDITDQAGVRNGQWGWGAAFLDYDNDGDLDLAQTNGVIYPQITLDDEFNTDPTHLWENDGTGVMTDVAAERGFLDTRSGKALIVFDYDRDGDEDVFMINSRERPALFRNDGGNQNSWLQVVPRGSATNHFGLGVRVYAQADPNSPEQLREIVAGGFMGNSEPMAHFGFGPGVERIDTVRVVFPAGGVEHVYHNVPARRRLTIYEQACDGDIDGDRAVTFDDLSTLLIHFDAEGVSRFEGDLNDDERVDLTDLAIMLANFSAVCE